MRLIQLIYSSEGRHGIDQSALRSIIEKSQRNNANVGISGTMCFNGTYFLQCLEGARDTVNATYARILRDPLHSDAVILRYREIAARDFPNWSMGYIPSIALGRDLVLRFCGTPEFSPAELSAQAASMLLVEMHRVSIELHGPHASVDV